MIETTFLDRCIRTLEKSLELLNKTDSDKIEYDMYRSASVKEFELILEQTGKLLRKCLKFYFHSPKDVDALYFKDVFRYAAHHGILSLEEVERWMEYRDNRNSTAHDYGKGFAEKTLLLLPHFIVDAKKASKAIQKVSDDQSS